jgi:hypothetical protein
MKRITDDTIVKVKVPKHLYESIMKRMALKENEGIEEKKEGSDKEDEKPKYAGMKMSKSNVMDKVGRSKTKTIKGDMAKAYQPVHSRVHKEGEQIEENLIDILANVDIQTLGMIATALGITGGAAALANMIKKEKGQPGGSTGAYL